MAACDVQLKWKLNSECKTWLYGLYDEFVYFRSI